MNSLVRKPRNASWAAPKSPPPAANEYIALGTNSEDHARLAQTLSIVCSAIGLKTGSAGQDYIGLYGGGANLLSESLEYVQRTVTQLLTAIGADGDSAPPAECGLMDTRAAKRNRKRNPLYL